MKTVNLLTTGIPLRIEDAIASRPTDAMNKSIRDMYTLISGEDSASLSPEDFSRKITMRLLNTWPSLTAVRVVVPSSIPTMYQLSLRDHLSKTNYIPVVLTGDSDSLGNNKYRSI